MLFLEIVVLILNVVVVHIQGVVVLLNGEVYASLSLQLPLIVGDFLWELFVVLASRLSPRRVGLKRLVESDSGGVHFL